nr:hypothetical protein [Tanacetum cinerariifolium]
MLGISITSEDVFTKYVVGLQRQILNELRMYSFEDISSAIRIPMAFEVKNKNDGLKIEEDVKGHIVERDNKKKVTVTTNNLNNFFEKCQISGHVKEKCWKAHPEFVPKKGAKNDRRRRTVSTTISKDVVELGQVEEENFENRASLKCHTEEDPGNETHMILPSSSHKPFKVKARVNIPSYDGTVDAEKLDSWIDQLKTYFTLYGLSST